MRTFTPFHRRNLPPIERETHSHYLMEAPPKSFSVGPEQFWTWRDAEDNAAYQMRMLGYRDAVKTPAGTRDIDVSSTRAVGQVKHISTLVSRPYLTRLYGTHGGGSRELWYFTPHGYTEDAVMYADEKGMMLFTYIPTGELESVNRAATVRLAALMSVKVDQLQKVIRLYEKHVQTGPKNARRRAQLRRLYRHFDMLTAELEEFLSDDDEVPEDFKACAALELSYSLS